MKAHFTFFVVSVFLYLNGIAQVGIGTTIPNAKAALEISDTARGVLIPRMTSSQKNNIINIPEGLMIYQTDSIKGFWYFNGVDWQTINSGKQTIVLSGDISNAEAQIKIMKEFGPNTQVINIQSCRYLTNVDLSMVKEAIEIDIVDNTVLQSINLQNLTTCDLDFKISNCPALTDLNLSSLKIMRGIFSIGSTVNISIVDFPSLTRAGYIAIGSTSTVSQVLCPSLISALGIQVSYNSNLTNIYLPILDSAGYLTINGNSHLINIDIPALTKLFSTSQSSNLGNPILQSININSLIEFKNPGFSTILSALPSPKINSLLNKFATISPALTGRTFYFYNNTPPAPPTGQGLIDKATLIANGNTVATD